MTMRTIRIIRAVAAASAASAVLATAACGTAPNSARIVSGSTATSSSPSPVTKAFTGTQLKSMLVTDVPAGFSQDTTATADSGAALQLPSTGPVASKSKCGDLNATSFISATGLTGVSFAQSDYVDKNHNEISQEIDAFEPGNGSVALTRIRKVFTECATFSYKADGVTATEHLKVSSLSGVGDEAVRAVINSPQFYGGTTLVVARIGDNVVSAFYNDTAGSLNDGHIVDLVQKIVSNVKAGA